MAYDSITKLPAELIYTILSCLDDPGDLYATIQASSHIFRGIFRGSENTLLSNVLKNAILSPTWPDALLSLHPLVLQRDSCRHPDDFDLRTGDLIRVIRKVREWGIIPDSIPNPRRLACLHLSIDYFIRHSSEIFLSTAMREAKRGAHSNSVNGQSIRRSKRIDNLSHTELARFQRAFYRYSMIQDLSPSPIFYSGLSRTISVDNIEDVFSEYTPWEIEEIGCIHQYILGRLRDTFRQMEECFVNAVTSTEDKSTSKYLPTGEEGRLGIRSLPAEDAFSDSDYIYLQSEKEVITDLLEHLASCGLPFLYELFEADNNRRKELIVEKYGYKVTGLETALTNSTWPIFKGDQCGEKEKVYPFEKDDYWKRNSAWVWANQYHAQYDYYLPCNFDFREWGYVFWDSARLDRMGVMKAPLSRRFSDEFPPNYDDPAEVFCNEPSAQKRLRDLGYA